VNYVTLIKHVPPKIHSMVLDVLDAMFIFLSMVKYISGLSFVSIGKREICRRISGNNVLSLLRKQLDVMLQANCLVLKKNFHN
jgi:hypothetical protein